LSAVSKDRIASPDATAVLLDSQGGWNLAGGPNAAAPRHNDGTYMLFADGSTRWMRSFNGVMWNPRPPAPLAGRRKSHHRRSRSRRG
jgi:prepilin-type processing-associated H-X9-DG protein